MVKNYVKGVFVSNMFALMVYFSQHKGYRNSYLIYSNFISLSSGNILATFVGMHASAYGLNPLFSSYIFSRFMPIAEVLEDDETFGKDSVAVGEFTSMAYLSDLAENL